MLKLTNDPHANCPTCGRALNAPYRRIRDGRIVEGCVDDAHTGHLMSGNTRAWHERAEARQIRRDMRVKGQAPAGHVYIWR